MITFKGMAAMAAIVCLAGPARAETELLVSTFFPSTHPLVEDVLVPWAEAVEKESGGDIVIDFAAASLAPPPG